jgi:Uncharacterized conserved protein (DUF2039)
MPKQPPGQKKKKKGRTPAHQNTFAFRHNPKSKLTEKILESPILHCCRRCHDKLEWRKKYRKYKPRSQLGTCNLCREKRIKHAYHTICTKCTTTDQAWKGVRNAQEKLMLDSDDAWNDNDTEDDGDGIKVENISSGENEVSLVGDVVSKLSDPVQRVCAVCAKSPALPDEGGQEFSIDEVISRMGPMTLRQRRGLERQLLREQKESESSGKKDVDIENDQNRDGSDNQDDDDDDDDDCNDDNTGDCITNEYDEDDPFLRAIGGTGNMLVGENYQKMLLAKANEDLRKCSLSFQD